MLKLPTNNTFYKNDFRHDYTFMLLNIKCHQDVIFPTKSMIDNEKSMFYDNYQINPVTIYHVFYTNKKVSQNIKHLTLYNKPLFSTTTACRP